MNILALSGGGFKGLYTAKILERLEEELKVPIAQKFDLIAGTSIGGIIALALAYEIPCKKIVDFFNENGKKIFKKRLNFAIIPKYGKKHLKDALAKIFGNAKIGDLKHRVIIPTINYSSGKVQLFKTRHHPTFITDYKRSLVDVAMSTAAAPIYFPVYHTGYGDFADGGLVANHPGFFAILEAKQFLNTEESDISMLHIGTLSQRFTSDGRTNLGLLRWRTKLLNLLFSCQDQSVNQIVQFLLNDRYYSIDEIITEQQSKKIALDKADDTAINILIHHAEEKVKEFMGTEQFRNLKKYTAQEFKPIPLE